MTNFINFIRDEDDTIKTEISSANSGYTVG